MLIPRTTFTNGKITLGTCLVFRVILLTDQGWLPWSEIPEEIRKQVRLLLDYNPSCPEEIRTVVYGS